MGAAAHEKRAANLHRVAAVSSWLYLTFVELHPAKVLSAKNWADASFARLWWIVSPIATARNEQLAKLMKSAEGVVVDIGTGETQ